PQARGIGRRPGRALCRGGVCVVLLGADQPLPPPRLNRAHCFNGVQDQVQDDLLHLNAVAMNGKQAIREPGLYRDAIPDDYVSGQSNDLIDCPIKIKTLSSRGRFLDVITHPADDILGSVCIPDYTSERFPRFIQIRPTYLQKAHADASVVTRRSDRVQNFVSDRGGQFAHYAQTVQVCDIRLKLAESRVFLLRAFALGQVEDERNALVATFFEQRAANQHWHAPA